MLPAAFIFLCFMRAIRSMLESAESPGRGSAQLARLAYAGGLTFLVTLLTVLTGTGDGRVFGYAFCSAIPSLVTWTIATSIASASGMPG
jgi:hypothetical protein